MAFGRIVRLVARRPLLVLAVVGVLALAGAALALRLEPSAATSTSVDPDSDSYRATERFKRDFGDEAVLVLVDGDLSKTVLTEDLGRLLALEGCLSGNVPQAELRKRVAQNREDPQTGLPPVCEQIAELNPAKAVYGPGTFVNTAVGQIQDEFLRRAQASQRRAARAAAAARKASAARREPAAEQERLANAASDAVVARFQQELVTLALRYKISGIPTLEDASFVSTLVFTSTPGVPKSRFAYLFPSEDAALVQIRLRPGLSEAEQRRAIALVREATEARVFTPRNGARYVVTGVPVVAEALADAVESSVRVLLGAALVLMAATLLLVFRSRLRLLPLGLALAATAMTFGALSLAGGDLTMASIAVLPVLIGLAVDYAIQFQARFDEELARSPVSGGGAGSGGASGPGGRAASGGGSGPGGGADPGGGGAAPDEAAARERRRTAAVAAATAGGPTIATAGLATAVGFMVLLLSPVPMVRGFGVLLVLGIAVALACALLAGFAALVRFGRPRPLPARPPLFPRASEWVADRCWLALGASIRRPGRVLAVGLAIAVLGLALHTQGEVVSDVTELVPQDLQALKDVDLLQQRTGVSGEIDVAVRADDITDPAVLTWMSAFQRDVLKAHGYEAGKRCSQAEDPPELCPALSLPDLFESADRRQVTALLDAVPEYFSQVVVTRDRDTANLAFGIRLMSLDRQAEVIDDVKARLDPPAGVTAEVVGVPVLAAEANGALSSPWRRALTLLAALAAVFLVLLAVRRSLRAAAVPLIPIALATGWSGVVLFALGLLPGPLEVDLNPMSVTLGALVIAISTEFSVLLSARYRQERERGAGPARAVELTYASTGAAVLASGATAIVGFAALVASDIRMLRDFGIVTVVDLTVSLIGVMLVLPAALLWTEQRRRAPAAEQRRVSASA